MRFSQTGFGGVDHERALPFAMNAHDIVKLMAQCQFGGGNLVFNISPNGDGSVDPYERETLATVASSMISPSLLRRRMQRVCIPRSSSVGTK